MMIDRHTDATKSVLFVLVLLHMCIISYFFIDDVYLSVVRILVAMFTYCSYNGGTAGLDLILRH